MQLHLNPGQTQFSGGERPIPVGWKKYLTSWSIAGFYELEFGSLLLQKLESEAFSVSIWTLEVLKTVRLYPTAERPTIALEFTFQGNIDCLLSGYGTKQLRAGNYELFYVPRGIHEALFVPGFYEILFIEIQPAFLRELVEIRPEVKELQNRFQSESIHGMPMAIAYMDYKTMAILRNLQRTNKTGASLQLDLHRFILELLSAYLDQIFKQEQEMQEVRSNYKKVLEEIKNYILLDPNISVHTLDNLAIRFQVSKTLLKREFKKQFHQNLSAFVRLHALAKSHEELIRSNRTIEDITEEAGYSWRPAFEMAFKKHFGYSAYQLRSDRIRKN